MIELSFFRWTIPLTPVFLRWYLKFGSTVRTKRKVTRCLKETRCLENDHIWQFKWCSLSLEAFHLMKHTKVDIFIATLFPDPIKLKFSVHLRWLKDLLMIESVDWMVGIAFNITCSTTAAKIGSAGIHTPVLQSQVSSNPLLFYSLPSCCSLEMLLLCETPVTCRYVSDLPVFFHNPPWKYPTRAIKQDV